MNTNRHEFISGRAGLALEIDYGSAGDFHTVALREDGTLWAWGHNGFGQLGIDPIRQVLGGAVWGPPRE